MNRKPDKYLQGF